MLSLKQPGSFIAPSFLSFVILTSGCDSLGLNPKESIFLTTSTGEICFRFTGITAGGSKSVLSVESISIESFLQQEGFSLSEVISATVTRADIRLLFPLGESLSMLDRATVSLRASGAGEAAVASAASFPNVRTASLQTQPSNIGGIVKAGNFQGVLQVVGDRAVPDDIEISVTLQIRVELQGI